MAERKTVRKAIAGFVTGTAALVLIGSNYGFAQEAVTASRTPRGEIQLGLDTVAPSVAALGSAADQPQIGSDMQKKTQSASVKIKEKAKAAVGELTILNERDYKNLLQIVEAEAGGEDMRGKILVANVILNRVDSKDFPNNVTDVIYQKRAGHVQFSPVGDGRINKVNPQAETKEAVRRALVGEDYSRGALYFSAREAADPGSMRWFDQSLTWLFRHGRHEFYK